jgi:hypothetical protein
MLLEHSCLSNLPKRYCSALRALLKKAEVVKNLQWHALQEATTGTMSLYFRMTRPRSVIETV